MSSFFCVVKFLNNQFLSENLQRYFEFYRKYLGLDSYIYPQNNLYSSTSKHFYLGEN